MALQQLFIKLLFLPLNFVNLSYQILHAKRIEIFLSAPTILSINIT